MTEGRFGRKTTRGTATITAGTYHPLIIGDAVLVEPFGYRLSNGSSSIADRRNAADAAPCPPERHGALHQLGL